MNNDLQDVLVNKPGNPQCWVIGGLSISLKNHIVCLSFLTFYLQIHGDIAGMLNKLIDRTRIDERANMLGDRVNIQKRSGQARTMD